MPCLVLIAMTSVGVSPARGGWKAGVARGKITPVEPMWMAGYGGRDKPAQSTLQDLWVKALALEDAAGHRVVVVTTDLLGLPRSISRNVCGQLESTYGLKRDDVMLTSSHTHCGPVLRGALYDIYPLDDARRARVEAYSTTLERKMVETVRQALERLSPATVSAAQGTAGFAVNRRENRPEGDVPKLRKAGKLRGPTDHAVPVLRVLDPDGALRAVVIGYACHCTTLSFYQWCGDYAGYAQEYIEQRHEGMTALFYAGCGADQNPLPRRTVELAQDYGRQLADAVDAVLARPGETLEPVVRTAFTERELALGKLPDRAALEQKAEKGAAYEKRWAERMLGKLDRGEKRITAYPYPIQAWRLGERQLWIALGGEVVVDYALRLKKELGDAIWVTGYANDVMAYIPSLRVLEEGGYEGDSSMRVYGMPTIWAESVEERVVSGVHAMVAKVKAPSRK
jgi:hypothetical protein